MTEWRKVHRALGENMAQQATETLVNQTISLQRVILPLLSAQGLRISRGMGTSTVLELLKNKNGVCFPWYKSGLIGYEYITEKALEGMECTIDTVLAQFLCKVIEIEKGDTEKLQYWIRRFAALFNHLADSGKISYGILGPFIALPLASSQREGWDKLAGMHALRTAKEVGARLSEEALDKIEAEETKVQEEVTTRRIALIVYPYTHLEREELNEFLGNPAFVEEGESGTDDWSGLPEVG
jgi:hypothetical protein